MVLNCEWISGFVDGEGCFHVAILRHHEMTLGYQVLPEFVVVQHQRDKQILFAIKEFFGCGVVRQNHGDRWCYRVRKIENLKKICDFFDKHPLKTRKNIDFIKFRKVIDLVQQRKHLEKEGLKKIINIALTMNSCNRKKLLQVKMDIGTK